MFTRFFLFILPTTIFIACSNPESVSIDTYSCGDGKGNDTIKWDIFPLLEGTVKIYSYENPNYPEFAQFEKEVNINDGKTVISSSEGRNVRKYYYLSFNNIYSTIVSNRFIKVDSILNLRDLGGYKTENKQAVRWGKLFRSGRLNLKENGRECFNSLHLKTVIDFRTEKERQFRNRDNISASFIHIPIASGDLSQALQSIKKDEFKRGDAFIFMQDNYRDLAINYCAQFKEMFEILSDSLNYPVLMLCTGGKDRVGFASALVLSALGIPKDQIFEDYSLSYSIPNIRNEGKYAYQYSPEGQEAVTALLSTNKQYLETAFQEIEREYSSMDNYLDKALGLNKSKREHLQKLLLYYSPY